MAILFVATIFTQSAVADKWESGWYPVTVGTRSVPMKLEIININVSGSGESTAVNIDYRYRDARNSQLSISVQASGDNGAQYIKVPVATLQGDLLVQANANWQNGKITWSAGNDWPNQHSTQLKLKLGADDRMFLVVDVSNGPEARFYPVTSLNSSPDDLTTNDQYKTTKIVLRRMAKGSFLMGKKDAGNSQNTTPQHHVVLTQDFYMGVFEVTQKQWLQVMGTAPSKYSGDKRPVENISWMDIRGGVWPNGNPAIISFFGKLRARTGMAFDLPSEAQWEYSCRAGTTKNFNMPPPQGADNLEKGQGIDANLDPLAWYSANSLEARHREVGTKIPNALGLFDMHGNVYEWCLDWYGHYSNAHAVDPKGSTIAMYRIYRGGSWFDFARDCIASSRKSNTEKHKNPDIGLRLTMIPNW